MNMQTHVKNDVILNFEILKGKFREHMNNAPSKTFKNIFFRSFF
jgi:hypothetical protein